MATDSLWVVRTGESEALFQALRDLPQARSDAVGPERVWNLPARSAAFTDLNSAKALILSALGEHEQAPQLEEYVRTHREG